MKIGFLILLTLFFGSEMVYSQTNNDLPDIATLRSSLSLKDYKRFNKAGINLNRYDWSSSLVNSNIYAFNKYQIRSRSYEIVSYALLSTTLASTYAAFKFGNSYFAMTSISIGILSVVTHIISIKHKKKSQQSFNLISDHYRSHNLF